MVSTARVRTSSAARIVVAVGVIFAVVLACAPAAFAATVTVRIETPERTIFSGPVMLGARDVVDDHGGVHAESNNAMSAIDAAAQAGAFPLDVDYSYGSAFLNAIDGVWPIWTPSSPDYWVLRVNGVYALTGASDQALKNGDTVLEYAGADTASPTAVTLPRGYVAVNATATIVASQLATDTGAASPLAGASVHCGAQVATSGADGTARFRMTAPGDYGVRVEAAGCIRSAISVLHVRYATAFSAVGASKTKVAAGTRITLWGALAGTGKTPSGRRVALERRKSGSSTWTALASTVTDSAGAYRFSTKVSGRADYRVTFAGDGTFGAAASAIRSIKLR